MAPTTRTGEQGFTYLAALFLLTVLSVMCARTLQMWHTLDQREREDQLCWVGEQYRTAIGEYYRTTQTYPPSLDAMLRIPSSPITHRTLRTLYHDPLTNLDWGLIKTTDEKGITGVYSQSAAQPIKTGGFPNVESAFTGAKHYQDWRFVYPPPS